jgi:hypothetical protein
MYYCSVQWNERTGKKWPWLISRHGLTSRIERTKELGDAAKIRTGSLAEYNAGLVSSTSHRDFRQNIRKWGRRLLRHIFIVQCQGSYMQGRFETVPIVHYTAITNATDWLPSVYIPTLFGWNSLFFWGGGGVYWVHFLNLLMIIRVCAVWNKWLRLSNNNFLFKQWRKQVFWLPYE